MRRLTPIIISVWLAISLPLFGQSATGLTDSLVNQFNLAWNAEDLNRMREMLAPDAFFKSPYQLRYSRETMLATVLARNPAKYKVTDYTEEHSVVKEDMAWSLGELVCDVYDENGEKEEETLKIDFLGVFVKTRGEWKIQMLIYHE